jgi:hypothetical protein
MRVFSLLLTFSVIKLSFEWWDTGHMLVAQIAEFTLKEEGSQLY